MGSGGYTTTQSYLPLDGTLAVGALPNYDTDRDSDPGRLVMKGVIGLAETDNDKVQRWWEQLGPGLLQGTPTLDIWLAVIDFDVGKTGQVVAGIYDCAADKTDCNLLASGSSSVNQATFGSDFGMVVIVMSPIDVSLVADRGLMLRVAVSSGSDDDLWFAYGTTTYPTQLSINN